MNDTNYGCEKELPDLVVTKDGAPFKDQAEGVRAFKERCLESAKLEKQPKLYMTCDQAIWLHNALNRFALLYNSANSHSPKCAQHYRETHEVGCIIEIMGIFGIKAEDERVMGNIMASVKSNIPQVKKT